MENIKLSASSISTFQRCPYSFKLKYIDGIKPQKADTGENALLFGSMVHAGLEYIWQCTNHKIQPTKEGIERAITEKLNFESEIAPVLDFKKAVVMCERYVEHYMDDSKKYTDIVTENYFETLEYKGVYDGIISDGNGKLILEHKTTSSLDNYFAKLDVDLQIRMYAHTSNIYRVLYDVIKKPQIRIKKNETESEFLFRYAENIEFERREIELSKDDVSETIAELQFTQNSIKNNQFPRFRANCNNCGLKCDFYDICHKGN